MSDDGRPARSILIVGLPASGKTTFLAAFWHIVANSEQSRFGICEFEGNREYINQLELAWLAVNQLPRTPRDQLSHVLIRLEDRSDGSRFAISIPDFSGEEFLKFFARREWPQAINNLVCETSGILVFLNPEHVVGATTLADVDAVAGAAGDDQSVDVMPQQVKATEWEAENAPTAVVLVDLLHEMSLRRDGVERPLRVAVIVSAWDTMRDHGLTPEEWMGRDLALLHQYLLTNPDLFQSKVYGVSAQGGDVTEAATRERLSALDDPSDRVEVVEQDSVGRDLSAPIAWVTG